MSSTFSFEASRRRGGVTTNERTGSTFVLTPSKISRKKHTRARALYFFTSYTPQSSTGQYRSVYNTSFEKNNTNMIENKTDLADNKEGAEPLVDNEEGAEPCSNTINFRAYMAYRSWYSAFSVYCSLSFMSFVAINAICSIMCINGAFSLLSVVSKLKSQI